jgi:hypothetical protein
MATATYEVLHNSVRVKVVKWVLTDANPDGQPFVFAGRMPDKSVHVFGTFGSGGTVKFQGTNEVTSPTSWLSLNDPQGNELSISAAAKIEEILENTYQVRPYLSAGTGVTLTVILCLKG